MESTTGTPQSPFGFAGSQGYQEDGNSGLKLLGTRYYDPSTGRFITRDIAKGGRNYYVYCDSRPTYGVDRNGESIGAVIGFTLGVLVIGVTIVASGGATIPLWVASTAIFGGSGAVIGGAFDGDTSSEQVLGNLRDGSLGGGLSVLLFGPGVPVPSIMKLFATALS